nr:PREDICTED: glutathione S-transferase C-terminal domain-containing protein homolog [Bemisia tabaci]
MVAMDGELYLEVYELNANYVKCPVETSVSLYLLNYLKITNNVFFLQVDKPPGMTSYHMTLSDCQFKLLTKGELNQIVGNCRLPAFLLVQEHYCVAGLCAVLRQIVKASGESNKWLLGFREATMAACAEVSLWTRLGEVDLPQAVEEVIKSNSDVVTIPVHIVRFEKHLEQPLRTHNVQKFDQLKENCDNKILKPLYAEGFSMTLADLVILFYIHVFLQATEKSVSEHIPHVSKWYTLMMSESKVKKCFDVFKSYPKTFSSNSKIEYRVPEVSNSNLYRKEPKRYKPKSKVFTDQNEVDSLINMINEIDFGIGVDELPYGHEVPMDWDSIPFYAQPEGGHLPQKRLLRKQQQLENLMKAVIKIARDGDKIVDFCSGGGHLGIAIAYLLPKCSIILLDNKEKSLSSAKERIAKLGLQNTVIIQSNLDYFIGKYQIGTSLHACGVATDLVMKSCVDSKAAFVVCPCCYGSLKDNHVLEYPRSQLIAKSKLSPRDYLILSHCADQVHGIEYSKSSQGEKCMASLDSDRLLYAKENHYKVFISKLVPKSCTPKNNLLVGIPIPTI